jgi:antitoxin CptB
MTEGGAEGIGPLRVAASEADPDRTFDRIRWRCRRGLLELDLVLSRFLATGFEQLTPAQRETFSGLLTRADTDLWDLVSGRGRSADADEEALLAILRAVHAV